MFITTKIVNPLAGMIPNPAYLEKRTYFLGICISSIPIRNPKVPDALDLIKKWISSPEFQSRMENIKNKK